MLFRSREEYVKALTVLAADDSLKVTAGKRTLTLKPADLEHYFARRGSRGSKLPRGFQKVDLMEKETD